MYQKKIKMRTRPSAAVSAKRKNSSALTDRSSTILLVDRSWSTEQVKVKVQYPRHGDSLVPRSQSPVAFGSWIGLRNEAAPLTRMLNRSITTCASCRKLHHNCAINHTVSLGSRHLQCEARCLLESGKMVSILGNRGQLHVEINRQMISFLCDINFKSIPSRSCTVK